MPEKGSRIASGWLVRADSFEHPAVKEVAPRGSGTGWRRAARERLIHSEESLFHSEEWIIHSRESLVHSSEWVVHSAAGNVRSSEWAVRSVEWDGAARAGTVARIG